MTLGHIGVDSRKLIFAIVLHDNTGLTIMTSVMLHHIFATDEMQKEKLKEKGGRVNRKILLYVNSLQFGLFLQ